MERLYEVGPCQCIDLEMAPRGRKTRHIMKWKITALQTRLYLISAITLLIGLGSAVFIYLTTENAADSFSGYEALESKKYIRDLELYGGKANVLANEFMGWFDGLWHGKSLAFTVACITIVISLGLFFVAHHMPSGLEADARDEDNRGGTD